MYCWAQNTYFVPFDNDIPNDVALREDHRISYYQWVPFFLLIQAVLFYMPCLIWRLMSDKSGIRLHDIVSAATEKENIEPEFRARTIDSLSRHVEACLKFQHALRNRSSANMHRVFKCLNLRYYDSYVTGLYLIVKLLFIGNIFLNLLILNKFLETDDYSIYGLGVIQDLMVKRGWKESGNFPRVTLCDFEVRVLGNMQRHTVQCVLAINIFNEKIFILLWMWFSFLLVVTILDSLYWFSISLRQSDRLRFILRHLELTEEPRAFKRKKMQTAVKLFLTSYIKVDGVLILRMLAIHAGAMFCTELTEALWHRFLTKASVEHPDSTETESDSENPSEDDDERLSFPDRVRHSIASPVIRRLIQRRASKLGGSQLNISIGGISGGRLPASTSEPVTQMRTTSTMTPVSVQPLGSLTANRLQLESQQQQSQQAVRSILATKAARELTKHIQQQQQQNPPPSVSQQSSPTTSNPKPTTATYRTAATTSTALLSQGSTSSFASL